MDPIENQQSENAPTNGAATPATVKPWIADGFKSRAEMRAAKAKEAKDKVYAEGMGAVREKMAKSEKASKVKPKKKTTKKAAPVKAAAKKPAKKHAVKAKSKSKAETKKSKAVAKKSKADAEKRNYPRTAAERKKSAERTVRVVKTTAKREPNADEQKVMSVFRKGTEKTLREIADVAFPSSTKFDRYLRVKNAFRWLRATKRVKAVTIKRGDEKLNGYERIA